METAADRIRPEVAPMERKRILALCSILLAAALVACTVPGASPTPTSGPTGASPTSTPTGVDPTSTSGANPTPTASPAIGPMLSKADFQTIGIGMDGRWIRRIAFRARPSDVSNAYPLPLTCVLEGGGTVTLQYSPFDPILDASFVTSYTVVDDAGTKVVQPLTSPAPLQDFAFLRGGFSLPFVKNGEKVTYEDLVEAFGTPLTLVDSDATDEFGTEYKKRSVRFEGLVIDLWQGAHAADPSIWTYWQAEATSPSISTPRGLRCGSTLAEVAAMLGTGEFQYTVGWSEDLSKLEYWIHKTDQGMDDVYTDLYLEAVGGVVVKLVIQVHSPG
jgi:hypothetical protein